MWCLPALLSNWLVAMVCVLLSPCFIFASSLFFFSFFVQLAVLITLLFLSDNCYSSLFDFAACLLLKIGRYPGCVGCDDGVFSCHTVGCAT